MYPFEKLSVFYYQHNIEAKLASLGLCEAVMQANGVNLGYPVEVSYTQSDLQIHNIVKDVVKEIASKPCNQYRLVFVGFIPFEHTLVSLLDLDKRIDIDIYLYENGGGWNSKFSRLLTARGDLNKRIRIYRPSMFKESLGTYDVLELSDSVAQMIAKHYGENMNPDTRNVVNTVGRWYSGINLPNAVTNAVKVRVQGKEDLNLIWNWRYGKTIDTSGLTEEAMIKNNSLVEQITASLTTFMVEDKKGKLTQIKTCWVKTDKLMDALRRLSYVYDFAVVQSRLTGLNDQYVTMVYNNVRDKKDDQVVDTYLSDSIRNKLGVSRYLREGKHVEVYVTNYPVGSLMR